MASVSLALTSCFIAFCGIVHHLVSQNVQSPFIDEIFHLTQCNAYCQYKFEVWDNKITTPPGLYILGFCYAKVVGLLTSKPLESICLNYDVLRSVNLFGGVVVLPLILNGLESGQFKTINIISMPLLFAYYFLFYTDVWSLILIVGSLAVAINRNKFGAWTSSLSGLVGFLSLWFRQTNIIWIGFIASLYIERLQTNSKQRNSGFVDSVVTYIKTAVANVGALIPFILNFVLFAVFLKVNGGITFGDKENHEVNLHIVQVFYAFTFINIFTWPAWLSVSKMKKYMRFCIGSAPLSCLVHLTGNVLFCGLIKYVIDHFTIVHPFLLADNRHYTFYLWKRILSRSESHWFMIPIYHFCSWNIVDSLLANRNQLSLGPIPVITYILSIIMTVVPSPLFEPRYYITPLIVFRLFVSPIDHKGPRNLLEFVYLNAINVGIMVVFFTYEFSWDSEPGKIQRIIW